MDTNLNTNVAYYNSARKITSYEELQECRKRLADPHLIYGKDAIYTFFHLMGMKIDYDEIFL